MPFSIVRNNIVNLSVDAIVNAANSRLKAGGGVCGAIFAAAGEKELQEECNKIGYCAPGEAVLTKGYGLRARYIIHTVGPIWQGGNKGEETILRNCYRNTLKLAAKKKITSIAFPLISSGIYGYPKELALQVAKEEILKFLNSYEKDMDIQLVVFDKKTVQIGENLKLKIQAYIDDKYTDPMEQMNRWKERWEQEHKWSIPFKQESNSVAYDSCQDEFILEERPSKVSAPEKRQESGLLKKQKIDNKTTQKETVFKKLTTLPKLRKKSLEDCMERLEETFSMRLLRMIDERGLTDAQVYKKANIDRRHFSKIRSNVDYMPSRKTAIAFAIALELSLDDAKDLLASAGYALSHSSKFDVIISYYLENQIYDIFEINEVLFAFEQPTLS